MKAKSELRRDAEKAAEMSASDQLLDIHGEPIEQEWMAEFRGFFFGEGTLSAYYYPYSKGQGIQHLSIQCSMGLRSDDQAVIHEFQRRLGGSTSIEKYRDGSAKTITRWRVGTASNLLRVCRILESSSGVIPFLKARQLPLWREAIELKLAKGRMGVGRYSPEERVRLGEIHRALSDLKKWPSNNSPL